ncbi:hypothetical protein FGO68_gene16647 [Halteria grandinella]|uniref:Uncharacterized protein n=1 Tax=Halteria grandinella TaxID=5974 RepID=A0A8J8NQW0_HALGN|nr:hypothetical protein FGO68_gene16647 [Halteria grandinella]
MMRQLFNVWLSVHYTNRNQGLLQKSCSLQTLSNNLLFSSTCKSSSWYHHLPHFHCNQMFPRNLKILLESYNVAS